MNNGTGGTYPEGETAEDRNKRYLEVIKEPIYKSDPQWLKEAKIKHFHTARTEQINKLIAYGAEEGLVDTNQISDRYHTFGELYTHRIELWIAYCKLFKQADVHDVGTRDYRNYHVWRTRRHSDGILAFGGGWMILGLGIEPGTQITYHLPESYWDQCKFAKELEKAPEWDGHSSEDVLQRIKSL